MAELYSNVTAFNRYRRIKAERTRTEAEKDAESQNKVEEIKAAETIAPSTRMTKAQLLAIAAERGVAINEEMTKAQIVAVLKSEGGE